MPRIDEMYAFIAEDAGPDDEGIVAINRSGTWVPLVGADMKRVESLRPVARQLARTLNKPIKLIHFTNREDLGDA